MTPWLAFTTSLVFCIGSDGEVDEEEIGYLITALGGEEVDDETVGIRSDNRAVLDAAVEYYRHHSVEEFLETAAPLLSTDQKVCILLNMADSALSDGEAESEEQELILRFQAAFGISDDLLSPFLQALIIKNDKTIFGRR